MRETPPFESQNARARRDQGPAEVLDIRDARLRLALAASGIAVWDWNVETGQVYLTEQWQAILGARPAAEITSIEALLAMVHPDDLPALKRQIRAVFKGELKTYDVDHRVRDATGQWVWIHSRGEVAGRNGAGRVTRMIGANTDVTERKAAELKHAHNAMHDSLTGLPNRALFEDRLERACARARRECGVVALMYLDLDEFKRINDTYGHRFGDEVLVAFAARLQSCLRRVDTVARVGGDEFVAVVENIAGETGAEAIAAKIVEAMRTPMTRAELWSIGTTVSIGVAHFRGEPELTASALLGRADRALYDAKAAGRDRFRVFK